MELKIKEPKDMEELERALKSNYSIPEEFYVAVETNIFSKDKKWILMRRGPRLQRW